VVQSLEGQVAGQPNHRSALACKRSGRCCRSRQPERDGEGSRNYPLDDRNEMLERYCSRKTHVHQPVLQRFLGKTLTREDTGTVGRDDINPGNGYDERASEPDGRDCIVFGDCGEFRRACWI
jgi:hypothetical protein